MSEIGKQMAALAVLPDILTCARFLAEHGVLRDEDVAKCVRVYVKKHPEINEALARAGRTVESLMPSTATRAGEP